MKRILAVLLFLSVALCAQPNPTVVATQVAPPSPFTVAGLGSFTLAAEPSPINTGLIASTITSLQNGDSAANDALVKGYQSACFTYTRANNWQTPVPVAPPLYTLSYFLSPSVLTVGDATTGELKIPIGSLFVLEAPTGAPAGTCPAVPAPPPAGTPDIGAFLSVYQINGASYAYFTCISGVDTVPGNGQITITKGETFPSGYVYDGAEGSPLVVTKTASWGGVWAYYVSGPLPPAPA